MTRSESHLVADPRPGRTAGAVSVVIATMDRPGLLERAVRGVLVQDHGGPTELVVVFDRVPVRELAVAVPSSASLRYLTNVRTPGLAGARNTGILATSGEFLAFCDDDDEWLPGKLAAQKALLSRRPDAVLASTGITVRTESADHLRLGPVSAGMGTYLRRRVPEVHPSTFFMRRADLVGRIGLIDEELPASYGEDYDLLLRASRLGPTVGVQESLVNVYWNRPSFFAGRWDAIAEGLTYILAKTPEFEDDRRGLARVEGQIAFAHAALSRRRLAIGWAARALRHHPLQPRAWAALLLLTRLVDAAYLVEVVQKRGRGL